MKYGDFEYRIFNDKEHKGQKYVYVYIEEYKGKSGKVTIPPEIEGVPVTVIGKSAFAGCIRLENINLPDTITSLGENAFKGCRALKGIRIPECLKRIDDYAFHRCVSLRSIKIPAGVYRIVTENSIVTTWPDPKDLNHHTHTYVAKQFRVSGLGNYVFAGCKGLKEVILSEGVTALGDGVFKGCGALKTIVIPESVGKIGLSAFEGCSGLKDITLPKNKLAVEGRVFKGCVSLRSIDLPKRICALSRDFAYGGGGLEIKEILSPEIAFGLFENCKSLVSVVIPEGITSIDEKAFAGCANLKEISFPKSLVKAGRGSFSGCKKLCGEKREEINRFGKEAFSKPRSKAAGPELAHDTEETGGTHGPKNKRQRSSSRRHDP
jgi:hypothetical protein